MSAPSSTATAADVAAAPPHGDGARLRVEMVLPTLASAGMEVMVADLARALARRGHDVGVTCLEEEGPQADVLRADGLAVTLVRAPGLRANLGAPALVRHFARRAPDVVHVHSGAWAKAAVAARQARVPAVMHTVHGLFEREPWYGPPLKRWAARFTDTVVVVSEPLQRYCVDVVGVAPARTPLVLNGIDVARFAPGPRHGALRGALGVPDDAFLVGTVARLAPVKNQAMLVDAFALLHARVPRARLAIIGEGELRGELEARIAALGLDAVAHLPGATVDTAAAYRDLDAFVLCSVAEGTSISLLEAMASGVPVVATAVGGSPAVVAHGQAGVLVPSGDAQALGDALVRLATEPALAARVARAARARVVDAFAQDAMVDAYERLYRGALAQRAPHSHRSS